MLTVETLSQPGRYPSETAERKRAGAGHDDLRVDEHPEVIQPPETVVVDSECNGEGEASCEQGAKDRRPAAGQAEDQKHCADCFPDALAHTEEQPVRTDQPSGQL